MGTFIGIGTLFVLFVLFNMFLGKLLPSKGVTNGNGVVVLESSAVKGPLRTIINVACIVSIIAMGWFGAMLYADPGYSYQIRTIDGRIIAYTGKGGWTPKWFGTVVPWKKAMSVAHRTMLAEDDESSSTRQPFNIRMLDRVDGFITQTTRFRLSDDPTAFLNMASEYRTPQNLLTTELIPAVELVITATSSLMGAEDYFNGKRNDFQMDFGTQMRDGMFMVTREEIRTRTQTPHKSSADASKGDDQDDYGDQQQTRFVVRKELNPDGTYKVNGHNYQNFGIVVVDAKVTDFDPNDDFKKRMKDQQQASADRSIAREQRIQEEEQKQLAIVRGERLIAEEQASVKKSQIKKTTEAETTKALVLIKASQQLEQAEIDKQTAVINLERDTTIAQSKTVLADADKYEREARIAGDGALEQKLAAWVKGQEVWADASAKRAVPQNVTVLGGSNGSGGVPTGSNTEMQTLQQLMSLQLAKQLNVDTTITAK